METLPVVVEDMALSTELAIQTNNETSMVDHDFNEIMTSKLKLSREEYYDKLRIYLNEEYPRDSAKAETVFYQLVKKINKGGLSHANLVTLLRAVGYRIIESKIEIAQIDEVADAEVIIENHSFLGGVHARVTMAMKVMNNDPSGLINAELTIGRLRQTSDYDLSTSFSINIHPRAKKVNTHVLLDKRVNHKSPNVTVKSTQTDGHMFEWTGHNASTGPTSLLYQAIKMYIIEITGKHYPGRL